MALSSTTVRMMITSAHSGSPASTPVRPDTPAAASRMISMGSFSCATNRCSRVGFSAEASLFGPYLASRLAASRLLNPSGPTPRSRRTSPGDLV